MILFGLAVVLVSCCCCGHGTGLVIVVGLPLLLLWLPDTVFIMLPGAVVIVFAIGASIVTGFRFTCLAVLQVKQLFHSRICR